MYITFKVEFIFHFRHFVHCIQFNKTSQILISITCYKKYTKQFLHMKQPHFRPNPSSIHSIHEVHMFISVYILQ